MGICWSEVKVYVTSNTIELLVGGVKPLPVQGSETSLKVK